MSMMIHRHKKARAAKQAALIAKKVDVTPRVSDTYTVEQEPNYVKEKRKYTKSEIMHMSTIELQTLANEEGIENALETSGRDLKEILINHFGL